MNSFANELPIGTEVRLARAGGAINGRWRSTLPDGSSHPSTEEELKPLQKLGFLMQPVAAIVRQYDGGFLLQADGEMAVTEADGSGAWMRDGQFHRDGGLPAIEWRDGIQHWYESGRRHRAAGPALVNGLELHWWYLGQVENLAMDQLAQDLAAGGRIMELVVPLRLLTRRLDGADARIYVVPSEGWGPWILANRDRYYPELAAAMRAQAMHGRMAKAPAPSSVTPTEPPSRAPRIAI